MVSVRCHAMESGFSHAGNVRSVKIFLKRSSWSDLHFVNPFWWLYGGRFEAKNGHKLIAIAMLKMIMA